MCFLTKKEQIYSLVLLPLQMLIFLFLENMVIALSNERYSITTSIVVKSFSVLYIEKVNQSKRMWFPRNCCYSMVLLLVLCLCVAVVHAGNKNKPHGHSGVLPHYDGKPIPFKVSAAQSEKLAKGEHVSTDFCCIKSWLHHSDPWLIYHLVGCTIITDINDGKRCWQVWQRSSFARCACQSRHLHVQNSWFAELS